MAESTEQVSSKFNPTPRGNINPSDWIFSKQQIENESQSVRTGECSWKEEEIARKNAVTHIFALCESYHISIFVAARASYMLHRFYMYQTIKNFEPRLTAITAILVASKTATNVQGKRVRSSVKRMELIAKSYMLDQDGDSKLELSHHSTIAKEHTAQVELTERVMVVTLGFDFTIEVPHDTIVLFFPPSPQVELELFKFLWKCANTICVSPIILSYPARAITASLLCLAAQQKRCTDKAVKEILKHLGFTFEKSTELANEIDRILRQLTT